MVSGFVVLAYLRSKSNSFALRPLSSWKIPSSRAYIFSVPQFAKAPEAKRQSLVCRDPRFAIENERIVGPLGLIVLARTTRAFSCFRVKRCVLERRCLERILLFPRFLRFSSKVLFQQTCPTVHCVRSRAVIDRKLHRRADRHPLNLVWFISQRDPARSNCSWTSR